MRWILLCITPLALTQASHRLRGVSLLRKALYEGGDSFTCLDGSETIPAGRINDDFCDCKDGSDEPGTAACPNGVFHCVNVGHTGVNVPSSRVNDGLCDCCDGSDEWDSPVSCPNNCDEIGRAAREERQRRHAEHQAGFQKRKDLVKTAAEMKASKASELEKWKAEKEELLPSKDSLNMAKEEAERAEREAKDRHSAAWKASKAQRADTKARLAFAALDLDLDGTLTAEELQGCPEFDKDGDGSVSLEEASYFLMGKASVDVQTFVDDMWVDFKPIYQPEGSAPTPPVEATTSTTMPSSKKAREEEELKPLPVEEKNEGEVEYGPDGHVVQKYKEEEVQEEVEDFDPQAYLNSGQSSKRKEDDEDSDEDEDDQERKVGAEDSEDEPEPPYDEATEALVAAADEARSALDEAERKISDLDSSIREAEETVTADFGPDGAFAPLKGHCAEWSDSQYTYKWCPFDRATQRDKNGGHETNLGVWGEWAGPDHDPHSQLRMTKGTSCWNGPERSTLVKLSCASETRLLSVSEPGRCEYEFAVETPAACKDPSLHAQDEL